MIHPHLLPTLIAALAAAVPVAASEPSEGPPATTSPPVHRPAADGSAPVPGMVLGPGVHSYFQEAIFPYEPTWFLFDPGWGDHHDNAKFQLSFAIRLVGTRDASRRAERDRPDGLYASYSQTSFWDLQADSTPFYDNSYRPELWGHLDVGWHPTADYAAVEGGFGHESNGQPPGPSRSLNHLFLRGLARWDLPGGWEVDASPRVRTYVMDLSDNPDIARYRGYVDLEAGIGQTRGWRLAALGRIGSQADRGSLQLDLSHPMDVYTCGWVQGYLYLQGFAGWSESLRGYDEASPQPRVLIGYGISR